MEGRHRSPGVVDRWVKPRPRGVGHLRELNVALLAHEAWGWMVSPRASISTNWPMRLERVSGFLAFPIL